MTSLLTATALASYLHRNRTTIYARAQNPLLLPAPIQQQPSLWSRTDIDEYFDGGPNVGVSCIVPANTLANRELQFGVYVCPTDTGYHIGLERPEYLGLYEAGVVTVHAVELIQTSSAVGPQSASASSPLINQLRADRKSHGETWENLAVFHLRHQAPSGRAEPKMPTTQALSDRTEWTQDPIGHFGVTSGRQYQQGRVVNTNWLLAQIR